MAQTGLTGVRASLADAKRDLARQQRRHNDPPAGEGRGDQGIKAGKWTPNHLGLPREDECPVTPLGIEGGVYHVLDSADQFRSLAASDFSHSGIQSLFALTPNYPEWAWPRYGRKAKDDEVAPIKSFEDDACRKALFQACARRGQFSPKDRLRGRGAWKLEGGQIIYHAGEELWLMDGGRLKVLECGLYGEHLYPRLPSIPAPWAETIAPADNPAAQLVRDFRQWNWERPIVDPVLLLGWLGVALLGGALKWRSAIFLTGDKETGKSTLQDMLKAALGRALVDSADTTAAAISQTMKHDALAVAIDELEAAADGRKGTEVIELARIASSGAFKRRGSAGHEAVEFQMRSAFLFSAINPPALTPQDFSRMAVLRLGALDKARAATEPPVIQAETGRMFLTRLMGEWHRFDATYAAYRTVLGAGGHSGRGQDTYGTLLAIADLLLGPELALELELPMADDLTPWSTLLATSELPETEDALANWQMCLNHILTSRVDAWKDGERSTVGRLLDDLDRGGDGGVSYEFAEKRLAQAGLGLIRKNEVPGFLGWGLAVPNIGSLVAELFRGSKWQGRADAGAWAAALRQGKDSGAVLVDAKRIDNRRRINGAQVRCTLIDLAAFRKLTEANAAT